MLNIIYRKLRIENKAGADSTLISSDRRLQCDCGEHTIEVHKDYDNVTVASLIRIDRLLDQGTIKPWHMVFNKRMVVELVDFKR